MQGGTDGLKRQPVDSPRGDELPTAGRFVPPFAVRRYSRWYSTAGTVSGHAGTLGPLRLARLRRPSDQELYGDLARQSRRLKKNIRCIRGVRARSQAVTLQKADRSRAVDFSVVPAPFFTPQKNQKNPLPISGSGARRRFFAGFFAVSPQPAKGRIRWRRSYGAVFRSGWSKKSQFHGERSTEFTLRAHGPCGRRRGDCRIDRPVRAVGQVVAADRDGNSGPDSDRLCGRVGGEDRRVYGAGNLLAETGRNPQSGSHRRPAADSVWASDSSRRASNWPPGGISSR